MITASPRWRQDVWTSGFETGLPCYIFSIAMLRIKQAIIGACLLLSAGCAVRGPATWRVEGRILAPPASRRAITLKTTGECPSNDAIAARRRGSRTVLTVNPEVLGEQAPGWLASWSVRAAVTGCVPAGQELAIAHQILEKSPLEVGTPYRLLHVSQSRSGYIDLGPENRLQVMTPIRRAGAGSATVMAEVTGVTGSGYSLEVTGKGTGNLLGVETSWYTVGAGGIAPLRTETRIDGVVEARTAPARNLFQDVGPGYYRLVLKADQTTVILAANSRAALEKVDPEACGPCVVVPRSVGVNAYLALMVNGREVIAPLGGPLRAVVVAAGKKPEEVIGTLMITKPFAGRQVPVEFDRRKLDVMNLTLLGNEVVRW
jgi:hypothetical protein